MARINGEEANLIETADIKFAKQFASEDATIVAGKAKSIEELSNEVAREKLNSQIDQLQEKMDKHQKLLEEYAQSMVEDLSMVEAIPTYEGVLIKPFAENPFQRLVRDESSGLILDSGGMAPLYKSNESGEWEEEEQFIHVGVAIEVGPTCKYVREGDIVMWRKPSETPIPFYKNGWVQVNEHSIMTIFNVNLKQRLKEQTQND